MFLLDRLGFLALLGLFGQAAIAWLFVGLFVVLLRERQRLRSLRIWTLGFLALASGLTVLGARFLLAFEFDPDAMRSWEDGQPGVQAIYCFYLVTKVAFAHLLLVGTCDLVGRAVPRAWHRLGAALLVAFAAVPWLLTPVNWLLVVQAPMMIGYCLASVAVLRTAGRRGSGRALLSGTLLAMAVVWLVHGVCAVITLDGSRQPYSTWLAFNSHIDAGLGLLLGAGLVVALLQQTHHRLERLLQEQRRLRAEVDRDQKLRALGALVSGVAHELNNPLTAILGFADELEQTTAAGPAARIIREQAQRCHGIVRSLSALAGECSHPRTAVDLVALVERVARGFSLPARTAGVRFAFETAAVPPVDADVVAIEQVIANLLANAIHASPPGGTVRIALRAMERHVLVDVDDEGPGVPLALRERLFEPFFTTKAAGKGNGLGLAVAFAIVRSHRGRLQVGDAPGGRGARFSVLLPVPAAAAAPAPAAPTAPSVAKTPRRLLLVDDEQMVCEAVRYRAERDGWQVTAAPSAEAALGLLDHARFDAVLCDLRMPGIGGEGLFAELKRRSPATLSRCLFFSGDVTSPQAVAFAARLERPMIVKPFDFTELMRRIERVGAGAA